jgi:type II secretory pathway component PulJ
MKFTTRDLIKLQWPLLGALVLIALGSFAAWRSSNDALLAQRQRDQANGRMLQIEQRLRQVRTEEQELRDRAAIFQRMRQSGVTGEERRLEWTELLDDIQRQLRIPGINYEFGVRKPLDNGGNPQFSYFASPMRIQLHLLHEEDLLRFLRRLQQEAKALLLIRNCTLASPPGRRIGNSNDEPARLVAECELRWISVRQTAGAP